MGMEFYKGAFLIFDLSYLKPPKFSPINLVCVPVAIKSPEAFFIWTSRNAKEFPAFFVMASMVIVSPCLAAFKYLQQIFFNKYPTLIEIL